MMRSRSSSKRKRDVFKNVSIFEKFFQVDNLRFGLPGRIKNSFKYRVLGVLRNGKCGVNNGT